MPDYRYRLGTLLLDSITNALDYCRITDAAREAMAFKLADVWCDDRKRRFNQEETHEHDNRVLVVLGFEESAPPGEHITYDAKTAMPKWLVSVCQLNRKDEGLTYLHIDHDGNAYAVACTVEVLDVEETVTGRGATVGAAYGDLLAALGELSEKLEAQQESAQVHRRGCR